MFLQGSTKHGLGSGVGGMQELFKDSCKQVDKRTCFHYCKQGKVIDILVFQGGVIGVFIGEAVKHG